MVGLSGLEPLTSRLSGARSNHLSYRPPEAPFFHPAPHSIRIMANRVGLGTNHALSVGPRVRARFLRSETAYACVETPGDDLETWMAGARPGSRGSVASRRDLDSRRHRESPRKEVIQPHLPVRLPCYDFVPIASPTFDGSLHKGWATGFGCCRLS